MPYGPDDTPKGAEGLPAKAKRVFKAAFNAAFSKYGEERAFKVAWSAVKRAGYRKTGGKWAASDSTSRLTKYDPFGREEGTLERSGQRVIERDRFGRETGSWDVEEEFMDARPLVLLGDAIPDTTHPRMMYDAIELSDARVEFTSDGYMKAMPRIARTGVQRYLGTEVGRPEMEVVSVYRPAEEVFRDSARKTYTHLPVTLDHPGEPVTPANWAQYAKGETGEEVLRDGETARVPMMLRDAAAIAAYKAGKNQLSVGYDCDLDWKPGVTDSGEQYDAVQRNIRANHLAVVAAARGGPQLKIGDDNRGETEMANRMITIDGFQCEMTDTAAQIVQRTITALQDQIENFKKKSKATEEKEEEMEDALTTAQESLKTKDAEIATLKSQLKDASDPAKLDAAVRDRASVFGKAKVILGDRFKMDGKTVEDIRRAVVEQKVGDLAKGWGDSEVTASFNTLTANIHDGGSERRNGYGTVDHARDAFSRPGFQQDEREAAYAEYDKELSGAYRGKQ